eukprot:CAMPEP_0177767686 /NCGR_PEP_ID=MMETSP0491_2-20121128/9274_1 /TAXON_ID=63592 /ORGANISM="Tetraselmis chuii, Strain PLY429" /LENGTH=349 /DNA_ID=CAMNT_0019284351 /DNA_START=196 /DNA_END=1245 /DNA_ORIENTATION=+
MSDNPFSTNDNPFEAPVATSGIVAAVESEDSPTAGAWGGAVSESAPPTAPVDANPYSKPPSAAYDGAYGDGGGGGGAYGGGGGGGAAYGGGGAYGNSEPAKGNKDLSERERELARREAELAQKEAQISRLETEAAQNASKVAADLKNWPRCCPIVRHDISGEIPPAWQGPVTKTYWSYLGLIVCLVMNCIAVTVLSFGTGKELGSFFMAVIYLVTATPLALFLWYLRLYNATIRDRAITFAVFFLMYLVHVIFCFWAAISPPIGSAGSQWSFAGIFTTISAFGNGLGYGILCIISTALWGLEAIWSLLVLQQTYSQFRTGGGAARLQQQATSAGRTMQMMTGGGGNGNV